LKDTLGGHPWRTPLGKHSANFSSPEDFIFSPLRPESP
jgi:hypothetical protein